MHCYRYYCYSTLDNNELYKSVNSVREPTNIYLLENKKDISRFFINFYINRYGDILFIDDKYIRYRIFKQINKKRVDLSIGGYYVFVDNVRVANIR